MGLSLVLLVVAGVLASQFHHVLGIAPILAALLCASCFLPRRNILVVGVGAMLVRDLLVGLSLFTFVRLAGILAVVGIIWVLRVRPSVKSLLVGLAVISPVYHLSLTVGDWILQYCVQTSHTTGGLMTALGTSFPYFQRALVGDLVFVSAFLTLYTLAGSVAVWRWPTILPQSSRR